MAKAYLKYISLYVQMYNHMSINSTSRTNVYISETGWDICCFEVTSVITKQTFSKLMMALIFWASSPWSTACWSLQHRLWAAEAVSSMSCHASELELRIESLYKDCWGLQIESRHSLLFLFRIKAHGRAKRQRMTGFWNKLAFQSGQSSIGYKKLEFQ